MISEVLYENYCAPHFLNNQSTTTTTTNNKKFGAKTRLAYKSEREV